MFSQQHSAKKQAAASLFKSPYLGSQALAQQAYIQGPNESEEDDDDQNNGTILLEEDFQPDYEPTQEEIEEYAEYLGMNLMRDSQYFYIAREGLKTQLPQPWLPMRNSQGEIFYVNSLTQEKTFVHPCDSFYKAMFEKEKQKTAEKEIAKRIELNKKKSNSIIEETKAMKNNNTDQTFFSKAKQANNNSILSKDTGNGKNKSNSTTAAMQKSSGKKSKNESNLIEVIEQPSEGSDQDISQEEYEKGLMEEEIRKFETAFIGQLAEKVKELKGKEQEFEKKMEKSVSLKKKQFTEKKNNWKSTVRKAVEREFQKQQRDEEKEKNPSGLGSREDNEQVQQADILREQETWMNEELKKTQSRMDSDLKTRQERLKGLQLKVQNQQKEFEQSKENVRGKEDSVRKEVGKILGEKREQAERIEEEKFKQESQDYTLLLQQELARITKLAHYDAHDVAKEEAVQKLQLRDLYQRKCDWHKSKGLAEIQDEVRKFYEEERKNLEDHLEKAERQYLQAALPIRAEEMQRKQKEELEGMESKHKLAIQEITGKYQTKIKADELEGVVRRNAIKREQQIQGKSILFTSKEMASLLPKTYPEDNYDSSTNKSNIEYTTNSKVLLQQLRDSMQLQMEQRSLLRHEKRQLDCDISLFRNQLEMLKLEQPMERIKCVQDIARNQNGIIHEYAEMLRIAKYEQKQDYSGGVQSSSSSAKMHKDLLSKSSKSKPQNNLFLKNSSSNSSWMHGYGISNGNDLAKSGASTFWSTTHKDNIPHFALEDTGNQQEQELYYQQNQGNAFHSQGGSTKERNKRAQRPLAGMDLRDQFISFHPQQQFPTNSEEQEDHFVGEEQDNIVNGQDQGVNGVEELHSNRVVFPDDDDSEEDRRESVGDSNSNGLDWGNEKQEEEAKNNQQDQGFSKEDMDSYPNRNDQYLKGQEPLLRQDLSNGDDWNHPDIADIAVDDPLEQFLRYEFTELQQLKRKLLQDKILCKKVHESLSNSKLRIEDMHQLLPGGNDSQRLKRIFQEMAYQLNQNVATTRQNQQNLMNRENALGYIEELMKHQVDQAELQAAIDEYSTAAAVGYVEIVELRNTLNSELEQLEQKQKNLKNVSSGQTAVKDQQKRRSYSQSVSSQKHSYNNYPRKNLNNNSSNSNDFTNMYELDRQQYDGMSTPAQNHRTNRALHNNFMNPNNYESSSNSRNHQMMNQHQQYYQSNLSSNWKGKENSNNYSNQRQQNQSSFLESRLQYEQSKREQLSQLQEAQNSAMQYKELQISYAGQTAAKLNELIEARDDPKEQLSLIFADHSQFLKHVKEQVKQQEQQKRILFGTFLS